jgi:hypothetical protein
MEVKKMSIQQTVSGDARDVVAYASQLGRTWQQSWVMIFRESQGGQQRAVRLSFPIDDRAHAHGAMRKAGIAGGSFTEDGLVVFTLDDDELFAGMHLGGLLGVKPWFTTGELAFVGAIEGYGFAPLDDGPADAELFFKTGCFFLSASAVGEYLPACPECGERRGIFPRTWPPAPVTCWCSAIPCRYCTAGRVRRPFTNHWDERRERLWHTPWFGYMVPCATCQVSGRGPQTIPYGEEPDDVDGVR